MDMHTQDTFICHELKVSHWDVTNPPNIVRDKYEMTHFPFVTHCIRGICGRSLTLSSWQIRDDSLRVRDSLYLWYLRWMTHFEFVTNKYIFICFMVTARSKYKWSSITWLIESVILRWLIMFVNSAWLITLATLTCLTLNHMIHRVRDTQMTHWVRELRMNDSLYSRLCSGTLLHKSNMIPK